jgi:hypothetical protein
MELIRINSKLLSKMNQVTYKWWEVIRSSYSGNPVFFDMIFFRNGNDHIHEHCEEIIQNLKKELS